MLNLLVNSGELGPERREQAVEGRRALFLEGRLLLLDEAQELISGIVSVASHARPDFG